MDQQFSHSRRQSAPSSRAKSKGPRVRYAFLVLLFIVAIAGTLLILNLFISNKAKFFPGVLTLDESLTTSEIDFLNNLFAEETLEADVTISAKTETVYGVEPSSVTYDALLPVTDFSDPTFDISAAELPDAKLVSVSELTTAEKLLSVDGNYYFETLSDTPSGAMFRNFHIDSKNPEQATSIIKQALEQKLPTSETVLTINQTGVTALSRGMIMYLNKTGQSADFFAENIKDLLSYGPYTHISNEVSFSDTCTTSAGTVTLCSDWRMLDALTAIRANIVELTGNHNNDWGKTANLDSINKYEELGMKIFGGGKDEESAKIPLELDDLNLTWIGVNYSTSTKANGQCASGNNPGANAYDEELVKSQIAAAKEQGRNVIVDVQYFECYSYPNEGQEMPSCDTPDSVSGQRTFFRNLIDFGADLVVGTSAHQPQTFEVYNGKPIFYGLGNLFFDQTAWPGTTRGLILRHYFWSGKYIQTRIFPTIYGNTYQTRLMDEAESSTFLTRLINAN